MRFKANDTSKAVVNELRYCGCLHYGCFTGSTTRLKPMRLWVCMCVCMCQNLEAVRWGYRCKRNRCTDWMNQLQGYSCLLMMHLEFYSCQLLLIYPCRLLMQYSLSWLSIGLAHTPPTPYPSFCPKKYFNLVVSFRYTPGCRSYIFENRLSLGC